MSKGIKIIIVLVLCIAAFASYTFISMKNLGTFREFHTISAVVEPTNMSLYKSLLPEPLTMPKKPVVILSIVDYTSVGPWPLTPYLEGFVSLRCSHNGVEGWHVKTMPVTKQVACAAGRMYGFPKYVADEISLDHTDNGWIGEVKHQSKTMLSLKYKPGLPRKLYALENMLVKSGAFHFDEPIFLFIPPDKGPKLNQLMLEDVRPGQWKDEGGIATIVIDTSEPWAGLVPAGTKAIAYSIHFTGGRNLVKK